MQHFYFYIGSGIGRLMSIEFAKRGCTVVLWDINREGNEETAEQARRWGVSAYTYVCDLSKRDAIYKCAEKVGYAWFISLSVVSHLVDEKIGIRLPKEL